MLNLRPFTPFEGSIVPLFLEGDQTSLSACSRIKIQAPDQKIRL